MSLLHQKVIIHSQGPRVDIKQLPHIPLWFLFCLFLTPLKWGNKLSQLSPLEICVCFRTSFSTTLMLCILNNNLSFMSSFYPLGMWEKENNYLCLLKLIMLWFVESMSVTWMHLFFFLMHLLWQTLLLMLEGCKGWTYLSPRASLVSNFKLIPLGFLKNLFLFLLICISESKCPSVFCCGRSLTHSIKNRIFYIVFGLRNCMFFFNPHWNRLT